MSDPMVMKWGLLSMQVCVPATYTDEQVEQFANAEVPTGIESRWQIRRQGDEALSGCDERVQCQDKSRSDCCHLMLDC